MMMMMIMIMMMMMMMMMMIEIKGDAVDAHDAGNIKAVE